MLPVGAAWLRPPVSLCAVWLSRNCNRVSLRELRSSRRRRASARVCEWAEPGLWDAAESVFRATVGKAARAFPNIPKQKAQNRPKTAKIQKRDEGFRLGVAVELVSMVTRKRACGLNPVRKRPATETSFGIKSFRLWR